jgi:hypothetical protein
VTRTGRTSPSFQATNQRLGAAMGMVGRPAGLISVSNSIRRFLQWQLLRYFIQSRISVLRESVMKSMNFRTFAGT